MKLQPKFYLMGLSMKLCRSLATICLAASLLVPAQADAACLARIFGKWFELDGSCSSYPAAGSQLCFTLGPLSFTQTDYILSTGGRAWVVEGPKRTPFLGDAMTASYVNLQSRYPDRQDPDPRHRSEADAAWAAFAKSVRPGPVSQDTLKRFARATGLEIRQGETSPTR